MDSEWVQQPAAMNCSDDEKNKLDLELRLGLPDNEENPPKNQRQHFDPTVSAANSHVDWSHLAPSPQGEKENHAPHEGVHTNVGAWPLQLRIHDYYANPTEHGTFPSTGIDLPLNHPPSFLGLPAMMVNGLFVDISQIRNMESGVSSSSGGPVRHRRQGHNDTDNPNKRCTNLLCNATTSPMWRRGPLGPKTLCNACGIKYRKEEEKRRTQVMMQQLHELATARHKPTQ